MRIDTYESEQSEELVRELLDGRFVNSAFCLFAPDGKTQLTRPGRSFSWELKGAEDLNRLARKYAPIAPATEAITPDFHSFRLALNIAAADGRLLVLITAPKDQIVAAEKRMRKIAWHSDIVGRFHFDLESNAAKYRDKLRFRDGRDGLKPGAYVIQPGEFGRTGAVVRRVAFDADDETMRRVLLDANAEFAKATIVKDYESHVAAGRREGIYFEMPLPFGEDRDADGKIDANHAQRFLRARRWAEQTGNLVPVD